MLIQTATVAQEASKEQSLTQTAQRLSPNASNEDAALRQAAVDFESLFIHQLLRTMRQATPRSELLPSSMARDVFEGMLDEELANITASAGGIGLADMLMAQLGSEAYNPR